jgi:hypothetical protein
MSADFKLRLCSLHLGCLLLALIIAPVHTRAQERALPAPWNRISSLSLTERSRIRAISDSTERAMPRLLALQDSTVRSELLGRGRSRDQAAREASYQVAQTARRIRFERDLHIYRQLSSQPRRDAFQLLSAHVDTARIFGFESFAANQQEPFWCWAAALQAVFAHAGIRLTQEDVGSLIGISDSGPVDSAAIRSTSGWHMSVDGSWSSECFLLPRSAARDPNVFLGLLSRNRPVLAVIDDDHVVVIHAVIVRPFPRLTIESVTWFDPYSDTRTLSWADATRRLTDIWSCWAVPPQAW